MSEIGLTGIKTGPHLEAAEVNPFWNPLHIDGVAIDLTHINPFRLICPNAAQPDPLLIDVVFSNHCFTESFDASKHSPSHKIHEASGRHRAFDQVRYDLSMRLPGIIMELPSCKVQQTPEKRNYVVFRTVAELEGLVYQVFFSLKKANRGYGCHLKMFVESAYPRIIGSVATMKRPNSIRFCILALKVYRGEAVRFAPR